MVSPQGGGGLSGLGQTFQPDLFTGTGNLNVPISMPPGRHGLQPALSFLYSTGNGNGTCGLGWAIGVSTITRYTGGGVPKYDETDRFILANEDILVPVEALPGRYEAWTNTAFSRIEHIVEGDLDAWRVETRDGLTHWYGGSPGLTEEAVIRNPRKQAAIFQWLLLCTFDRFRNQVRYHYQKDPAPNGTLLLAGADFADYGDPSSPSFLISAELAYEDRPDSFSNRKSGFELRTSRRVANVEIRVREAGLPSSLFRRYHLSYDDSGTFGNRASLLVKIVASGEADGQTQSAAPLNFLYSSFEPTARDLVKIDAPEPPALPLGDPSMEAADLFGNGLPDFVQLEGTMRVWENRGKGRLGRPRIGERAPAGVRLSEPGVALLDANGDGRVALLVNDGRVSGYYPMGERGLWDARSFQPYKAAPSFGFKEPNVRLIDLDGNGVTDAMQSGSRLTCYFNDPKTGWKRSRFLSEGALKGLPNPDFTDPRVLLADMTGDGLQDVVTVHNGGIVYWPNLGHGDWDEPVRMENSPRLVDRYDPKRLLLMDVDGDGAADLVYVGDGQTTLWLNRCGNEWCEPIVLKGTPRISDADSLRIIDFMGRGTRGVLWSKPVSNPGTGGLFFLDFTGGQKPYLLTSMDNGMGGLTSMEYGSSIEDYLRDQEKRETQWMTSLPFPVLVVRRVRDKDFFARTEKVTEISYHHGYWDGVEHTFRGFGRVESREIGDGDSMETRTWFHLGPIDDPATGQVHQLDYESEFWQGDPSVFPAPKVPLDWNIKERRTALRSLRGANLRTETYGLDGSPSQNLPYLITESAYEVALLRPSTTTTPGVATSRATAKRNTIWDRGNDPATTADFSDEYDSFGLPRRSIHVGVPRKRNYRVSDPDATEPYLVVLNEKSYAQRTDAVYMGDRVATIQTWSVQNDGKPSLLELVEKIRSGQLHRQIGGSLRNYYDGIAFQGLPVGSLGEYGAVSRTQTLIISEERLLEAYASADGPPLPPYLQNPPSWTPDYPPAFQNGIAPIAGYTFEAGVGYWSTTQSTQYDFQAGSGARGNAVASQDPLGNETTRIYDGYQLMVVSETNAANLTTTTTYHYRVLGPGLVTSPCGNRVAVTYSPLGDLATKAVMGKVGEEVGDDPDAPSLTVEVNYVADVEAGIPISVRTILRKYPINDYSIPPNIRDEKIEKVEYRDGSGRTLQVRVEAEPDSFGDPNFGTGLIPEDQSQPGGTTTGTTPPPGSKRVIVTGRMVFDSHGRLMQDHPPYFDLGFEYRAQTAQQTRVPTTFEYDSAGRQTKIKLPDGSEKWVVFGVPDTLEHPELFKPTSWETYSYDPNDNAGRTDPEGSKIYKSHWNTPTSFLRDAFGREILTIQRNGLTPGDELPKRQKFDEFGNCLSTSDALERTVVSAVFDFIGRSWRTQTMDGGTVRVIYDTAGTTVERRQSGGTLTLWLADELLRPRYSWARDDAAAPTTLRLEQIYGDSPDSGLTHDQAYALNMLGVQYRAFDESGMLTVCPYDFKALPVTRAFRALSDDAILSGHPAAGWPATNREQLLEAREHVSTFAYDALDRVISMQYPADNHGLRSTASMSYAPDGVMTSVSLDGQPIVERAWYDALRRNAITAFGNGVMSRVAFNETVVWPIRLRSERYVRPASPLVYESLDGVPLLDQKLGYDLMGDPLSCSDRSPGCGFPPHPDELQREYRYEPVYWLESATGRECGTPLDTPWNPSPRGDDPLQSAGYDEAYAYDRAGNLIGLDHSGSLSTFQRNLVPVSGGNRLQKLVQGALDVPYGYDAEGNLIQEGPGRTFGYDHRNHLTSFQTAAGTTYYLYGLDGIRAKKLTVDGEARTSTVYIDTSFELVTEPGGSDEARLYVCLANDRIATAVRGSASEIRYTLEDFHRSNVATLAADSSVLVREEFTPYGETSFGGSPAKVFRFSNQRRDLESGWYDIGQRYLLPYLGRWNRLDPGGLVDGPNLYGYVTNNPITYADASGNVREWLTRLFFGRTARYAATGIAVLGTARMMLSDHLLRRVPDEPQKLTVRNFLLYFLLTRTDYYGTIRGGHYLTMHLPKVETPHLTQGQRDEIAQDAPKLLPFDVITETVNGVEQFQLKFHATGSGLLVALAEKVTGGVPRVTVETEEHGFTATVVEGKHVFKGSRQVLTSGDNPSWTGWGPRGSIIFDILNLPIAKVVNVLEYKNFQYYAKLESERQQSKSTPVARSTSQQTTKKNTE